ncbi:hypothetical protein [Treponema sp. J25]|jgi:hypothetical protein|uniref:hypothetical protein n=1 Tax=Treponema sp. J25 TaxID=2094121 RepID=UPI00104BAA23|nr:hypothetical protein [Treponema sp. J25]TCW60109.1 hypothetical protein C5O22_13170 [Treponema sp. J25]
MKQTIIYHFWDGFSSVFNLSGGKFFNTDNFKNGLERDKKSIASDWQKVGISIKVAMDKELCCHE